ncbi:hypothetical protein VC159_04150 [Polynucleobacter sp. JS-JIR-II-c23]|uniref:hypothetical protein n=1 Tax=Polynucleobacter sp. JS-JIR-II-c23 TaxID=1758393 RepID=UPI002B23E391|nr:hypothetical protein [Polynucleobacter sp. JS-JIR-II-c23]MEA9603642.1 hypothetical protein [Polynucleobacter sp. JS-JIR-II-c23]
MTENLAKYLPLALRIGVDEKSTIENIEKEIFSHNQRVDSHQNQFLMDGRFSLRLDEII